MKWLLTIAGIASLAAGLYIGSLGLYTVMFVGAVAGGGFLVFANLDRIAMFKASGSGVEAQTREVVERAESAVKEVRLLAVQIAQITLSNVVRMGRWDGYTDDEKEGIRESLHELLRKLAVPESSIDSTMREWHLMVEHDYAHGALGSPHLPENAIDAHAEWLALRGEGVDNVPTPNAVRAFIVKHGFMTPEFDERIQDWEYYRTNRVHRRPEDWRKRQSWGHLRRAA